ncbi:MAG: MaoC/PaaZ C-terminal domain-containing protein [Dehalococcoidia bacterium]
MQTAPRWDDLVEGEELPPLVKPALTTQQLVKFAGASYDFYQIHYDLEFAKSTGLETVIAHGLLKLAYLGQFVTSWMGPNSLVRKLGCQYRGMDFPGDVITVRGAIVRKYQEDGEQIVELDVWTENQRGEKTTPGKATVSLAL